jgi:DNA-binding response OmpR family regulator
MDRPSYDNPLILLLEDEALIAFNLQDELQDAGYEVAGPFGDCSAALEWLQTAKPDAAILDATLNDGSCHGVAVELTRRGIPFLIHSGHQEDHEPLAEFRHLIWLEKPVPSPVLLQKCQQLLGGGKQAALS